MLSGYWLAKVFEDYIKYSKPWVDNHNEPILNDVQKIKISSDHCDKISLHGPIQSSNINYKRTLHLFNTYFFDDSTIIMDSIIN